LLRECDAILLETQGDLAATTAAVAALREQQPTVPILVSFSFGHLDGRLQPEAVAAWAGQNRGAVAGLGTNCGRDLTPADLTAVLRRYRRLTALPLLVRPNAGTPTQVDGRWVYPLTPAAFTAEVPAWREIGATLIGGCCGTTAEHVAALRQVL
jgi:methionine synthase I (cobalamin-dependent)